jgi:hypothetical protein
LARRFRQPGCALCALADQEAKMHDEMSTLFCEVRPAPSERAACQQQGHGPHCATSAARPGTPGRGRHLAWPVMVSAVVIVAAAAVALAYFG